ncbi:MAG TPA: glycosyltransferase family 4 protein [Candidatus Cloacimonadota bacterium]|nr:glycosyltransferase family 4 protein [Candidatus Cloacimonadota bacterium]
MEKEMVVLADRVFCVSNALKQYHMRNNPQIPDSKFFVSPCNADPTLFFYDADIRARVREKLEITDKKVIIYSGGLKMPWHIPDGVFELFARLTETCHDIFLLMLTSDINMAREFQQKHKIPDEKIKLLNLDNTEVSAYLNAADWAILLRHDMPVNNVASPTKFAEYLMAGLPVIISPNVGDFSDFVVENDVGFVIPTPYRDEDLQQLKSYLLKPIKSKDEIAQLGALNFSKKANIEQKIDQYLQLTVR